MILTQQFRLPGQTCDQSLTNFRIAFFLEDPSDRICIACKNLCRDHQLFQVQVNEFEVLKYYLIGHLSDHLIQMSRYRRTDRP